MSPHAQGYYELSPPPSPSPPRERAKPEPEENSTVPNKREKARERQRRKRERDRSASGMSLFPDVAVGVSMYSQDPEIAGEAEGSGKRRGGGKGIDLDNLSPPEAAKRERIRIAARERQRKHRAGVKAKRMAELGMAIVNEGGGIEQTAIGYTINENGQYEAVLADPSDAHLHALVDPPFPIPQPHTTPGQTFASTLLLSLSCTPLLKQQLFCALHLRHEELAAFEPHIAEAFDRWDHGRSMRYAVQNHHTPSYFSPQPTSYSQPYQAFGFREKFHRPLVPAFTSGSPHESLSPENESHHADDNAYVRVEDELAYSKRTLRHESNDCVLTGSRASRLRGENRANVEEHDDEEQEACACRHDR